LKDFLFISFLTLSTFQVNGQPTTDFLKKAENFIDIDYSNDRYNPAKWAVWGLGTQLVDFSEPDFLRAPTIDSIHIRLIYHEPWKKPILIRTSGTISSLNSWLLTVKEEGDNSLALDDFHLAQLTNKEKRQLKKSIENLQYNSRVQLDSIFRKAAIEDSMGFKFIEYSKIINKQEVNKLLTILNSSDFYELKPVLFHMGITHGTTASIEILQPNKDFHVVMRHVILNEHPELNELTRYLLDLANDNGMIEGEINDW